MNGNFLQKLFCDLRIKNPVNDMLTGFYDSYYARLIMNLFLLNLLCSLCLCNNAVLIAIVHGLSDLYPATGI